MNEIVTIPRAELERLREAADELADLRSYYRAKARIADGEDELVPAVFANRLLNGESPLRVYRELRGLTQAQLSEAASVNRVQIADIEAGRGSGSVATLRKLAAALNVQMEDIVAELA